MSIMDTLFDNYEQYEDDDLLSDESFDFSAVESMDSANFFVGIAHLCDGAESLATIADTLRAFADFADDMHEQGYTLNGPVLNGTGYAYKEQGDA